MQHQYYHQGVWSGPRDVAMPINLHGLWHSAAVFDGARSIGRKVPDLLLHCQRLVGAAPSMLLTSPMDAEEIAELCRTGIRRFPKEAELYITPLLFARGGGVIPDPDTTELMIEVRETPLNRSGMEVCTDIGITRPFPGTAATDFKTSWLYANAIPARKAARERGFEEAIMQDPEGNIVEFSTSNLWLVLDGRFVTPARNGSFLPGITRQRMLELLRAAGEQVEERVVTKADLEKARDIFSTGNSAQVRHVSRVDARNFDESPEYLRAHALYHEWLETQAIDEGDATS